MATGSARRPGASLTAQACRARVRRIRCLYTDNGGVTRGKGTLIEGLDGVTRKLEPGEPVLVDPGTHSPEFETKHRFWKF